MLRTKLEIHSRLLDILAVLLSRGVDPTVPDCEGNTASGKASSLSSREECFLDGAVLLGNVVRTTPCNCGKGYRLIGGWTVVLSISSMFHCMCIFFNRYSCVYTFLGIWWIP